MEDKKKKDLEKANEVKAEKDEHEKNAEDSSWRKHLEAAKGIIDTIKAETKKKYSDPKI